MLAAPPPSAKLMQHSCANPHTRFALVSRPAPHVSTLMAAFSFRSGDALLVVIRFAFQRQVIAMRVTKAISAGGSRWHSLALYGAVRPIHVRRYVQDKS